MNDKKIVDTIKILALDMIDQAGSGHPGIVLGAAPIMYTLFAKHLRFSATDPSWMNRDRFVLSCGHASALLYATLFMVGYDVTMEDLKKFRRLHSKTPGHPEYGITPGVEVSTGPLGQGFASAVGMAMGAKQLQKRFSYQEKRREFSVIDYYVYVMCSDGDLMEGVANEAASLAGTLKLNNLIALYDCNRVSLDGTTDHVFDEKIIEKFRAMGWHTIEVRNGDHVPSIDKAISDAKKIQDRPTLILFRTTLGKDSKLEGTNKVHGSPLVKEELALLRDKYGIQEEPFVVSNELLESFRNDILERVNPIVKSWNNDYRTVMESPEEQLKMEIRLLETNNMDLDLRRFQWSFEKGQRVAPREMGGQVLSLIASRLPFFIGGSADLASSCKTYLKDFGDFSSENYSGRNLRFGVREHAMGAILNGLALVGFRPFGSTFLVFSDYLKPAIRMAALMKLPVLYVFTHDSIAVGQDGPTHEPVEQLAALRSIPNVMVYRPADCNEVVGAFHEALKRKDGPTVIVLARQELPNLLTSSINNLNYGAYIVKKEEAPTYGILIATGSEVSLALEVSNRLAQKGIPTRVVSMPCVAQFLKQSANYKEALLPAGMKIAVIEAASSFGWHRFVADDRYLITMNTFGASGTPQVVQSYYGFEADSITEKLEQLMR